MSNKMNISTDEAPGDLPSMTMWNTNETNTGSLVDDPFLSMGASSNILVSVRVRPESTREKAERKTSSIVRVLDRNLLVFDPADSSQDVHQRRALGLRRGKELRFAFDRVFDDSATQLEVYENTAKALLDSVLDGYNATVFAYGATGAGKTFTMFGSEVSGPGILPLTIIDMFRTMERRQNDKNYRVTVSFLEVYNENIFDLLAPQEAGVKATNHEIREDKVKGIIVSGLSEHECQTADQALELVQRGISNRTQYGTAANAQSSRSHAVFQINVQQTDRTANIQADVGLGKLSLIDLAGSERASVTKNRGARLVEGANINKSLLALSNCINALGKNKGKGYVPYRNSKLTRLLKDSLGGNCKTVMVANLSPSDLCYEDTFNTLKYANRAKSIKTVVKKNIHNVNFHISKYITIIDELRNEVQELKTQLSTKNTTASSSKNNEQYERERECTEQLRLTLATVFQEQMKNRRSLMELEEQDRQNSLQVMSIRNEIDRWTREHPNEERPLRIHTRQKDADTLIQAKQEYSYKKQEVENCLQENIMYTKSIQDNIPKMLSNNELRLLIDQQIKLHDQEILNLDLERMIEHHKSKVQRISLVVEDAQYNSTKVHDIIQIMFDRLKETNTLTPEIENDFNMASSLLVAIEKQTILDNNSSEQLDPMVEDALKTPKSIHTDAKKRRTSGQTSSLFQLSFPNKPERTVIKPEDNNTSRIGKPLRARRQKLLIKTKDRFEQQSSVKINNFFTDPIDSSSSEKINSPQELNEMSNLSIRDDDTMLDDDVLFAPAQTKPMSPRRVTTASEFQNRHFSPLKKSSADDIVALKEKFEKFRTDYMEAKSDKLKIQNRPLRQKDDPSPNQSKLNKTRKFDESTSNVIKQKNKKVKFEGDSPSSPKPVPSYMAYTQSAQHRIGATTASKKKRENVPYVPPASLTADNDWILNLRGSSKTDTGKDKENSFVLSHNPPTSFHAPKRKPSTVPLIPMASISSHIPTTLSPKR